MKGYTDLEQSKKLAEILPIKSADMGWNVFVDKTTRALPIDDWALVKNGSDKVKFYPAWSLAALLDILSKTLWIRFGVGLRTICYPPISKTNHIFIMNSL